MKRHLTLTNISLAVVILIAAAICIALTVISRNAAVHALSARDFNAGNIIDDGVFYNKDAMNVQQIQAFLNQLIPNCDTQGTQPSGYGSLTNAQYAQQIKGWPGPPYACLNNYHENPTTGETSFEKGGGAFSGGISAAQILYNAAQQYGINPQVLLVLLKKESAGPLTSDSWPLKSQYKYAMGYACPDSGPNNSANCNDKQAGFYKQVTLAAWQLKYYRDHPNDYRYGIGWNDIQYSPDASCGTKRVYIENIATLSLYIYTPYTPNDAALANYPGTATCGAYGNRNFFMFFSEWFGSTRFVANFERMETARYLTPAQSGIRKINLTTNQETDAPLSQGQLIYFTGKTIYNGGWCLRTRFDRDVNNTYCIPFKDLKEIPVAYTTIPKQKVEITNPSALKVNPVTESTLNVLRSGQTLSVSQKFTFNNVEYYRSTNDMNGGVGYGIKVADVRAVPLTITPIAETTLAVKSTNAPSKIDIWSNSAATQLQPLRFGQSITFSATVTINGTLYYISKLDYNGGSPSYAVSSQDLNQQAYTTLSPVKSMKVAKRTCKVNLDTATTTNICYEPGTTLSFDSATQANSKSWYRSTWETTYNTNLVINPDDMTSL